MVLARAIHPGLLRLIAGMAAAILLALTIFIGAVSPARAQADVAVSVEFRTALEPHGKWHRHPQWGEVWMPAKRARGWRPYTVGQWVYTEDWGWYWTAADTEADWGWIVYHYGRWVLLDELGWVWVPGNEWGPGWVNWRRGEDHFGWAPLPPERVVVEYRDRPDVWVFIRSRDFAAPVYAQVVLPVAEYLTIVRRTVIVNRTVVIRDRRIAVNPGIAPAIIAARIGRPVRAFDVRPVVLAGTARIDNAMVIRSGERAGRDRIRVTVRETQTTIQPTRNVPKPQPLAANDPGRLGDNPPRAARQEAREERRDAREERRDDRRDAREDRQDDRRDARDDRRERREDRRDAKGERQEDRRDAREDRRDDRRETRDQKQEQRQERRDARDQKQEQRQDRRETREQRQDQRQEQRQDARERSQPSTQTEGRSPPAARQPDRTPPAARDSAPQRSAPTERPRSESPARRAPSATTGAAPRPQAAPQPARPTAPQAATGRQPERNGGSANPGRGRDGN